MHRKKLTIKSGLILAMLSVLAFTFLYPIIFMVINSFKSKAEYRLSAFALPKALNFDNYFFMLDQFNLPRYFFNTLFVEVVSIIIITLLAVFASYAFAKLPFKGSTPIYLVIVGTMFVPAQVTMIPMYYMFSKMGLINNFAGLILTYVAGGLPGAILLMTAYFRSIPNEIIEAAKIDGAGYFSVVKNIIFPMGMPAIAINIIFAFVSQFNDLYNPMILLQDREKQTVMVALSSIMTKTSGDPAFQLTGMLLAVIPPLVIYLIFQKYLIKGLTVGAIK